jgi:O-antigen/teichoic acid export membrane protein
MQIRRLTIASLKGWIRAQVAGDLVRRLVRQASAFYLAQIATFAIQFLTGLVVARQLGAEGYGRYALAISLMAVLRIAVALGLPAMLVKQVASYTGLKDWGHLKGILRFAAAIVAAAGFVVSGLVAGTVIFISPHPLPPLSQLILLSLPLLFIWPVSENAINIVKGLEKMGRSQLPDILRSSFFLVSLFALMALGRGLDPDSAMLLRVLAEGVGMILALYLVVSFIPRQVREVRPVLAWREWGAGLISFVAIDGMYLIYQQTDVLMLGALRSTAEVGVYRMAANLALVIGFAAGSAGVVLAPHVASAWASGRHKDVSDVSSQMSRIATGLTTFVYFGVLAGTPLIVYILGPDYSGLIVPLAILGTGHIARASTSSALNLITMTGAARIAVWGVAASAGLNIVLNAALIPPFGMVGSAIATTSCQILLAIYFAVRGYKRTGIDASILGRHAYEALQDNSSEETPG